MKTTIIIPTSSILSHPSTEILDETISTIRTHLPDSEIILMFDGLRKEHQDRRRTYNEYIRRALFKANTEYGNVYPVIFKEHHHQTGMTKAILEYIRTETILYIEQDTPLTPDWEIPFDNLEKIIKDGDSNLIRFHFESIIPKEHNHMMLSTEKFRDVTLMKTVQWSQRPHLSSLAFYRRILNDYFSELFLQNTEAEDINILKREISIFNIKTTMKKIAEELKMAENDQNILEAETLQKKYLELTKKLSALE